MTDPFRRPFLVPALLVVSLAVAPARAATGTSIVRGEVRDGEDKPLQGVEVTFVNTADPETPYVMKTNKKGRYFRDGLLFFETGRWVATAKLDGYVATKIEVTSRTDVAVIAKFDKALGPGKKPPEINIRPFGEATVDFRLVPENEVQSTATAVQELQPVEEVGAPAAPAAPAAPQARESSWDAGLRLASSGDLDAAAAKLAEAVSEKPDDAERHDTYAKVLYRLDRLEAARAEAARALAIDPARVGTLLVLYTIDVHRGNLDAAAEDLDRAGALEPRNLRVLEQKAWLAGRRGDPAAQIAAYEAMVAVDPAHTEAWVALGGLYAENGDDARSEAAYRKVVELDPAHSYQTFFNIGALIENRENLTEQDTKRALEAYGKAVEIKPDYAQAWYRLALLRVRSGDRKGARAAFERFLALEPDGPESAGVRAMLESLGG